MEINLNNNLNVNQEVVQSQNNYVSEVENFKNFIEDYEESIKETLFKKLDGVDYVFERNKKLVLDYKDKIENFLNSIKGFDISKLKYKDSLKIETLLVDIKIKKIPEIIKNLEDYRVRDMRYRIMSDNYVLTILNELCEDFEDLIFFYKKSLEDFQKEEREKEEQAKLEEMKKLEEKKPLNSITNSAEEKIEFQNRIANEEEVENFKNFIEEYEKYIKETFFKNLEDGGARRLNENKNIKKIDNKKIFSKEKEMILRYLTCIKEMTFHPIRSYVLDNAKRLLMKIKNEKIPKVEEKATELLRNKGIFVLNEKKRLVSNEKNLDKCQRALIYALRELCDDLRDVPYFSEKQNGAFTSKKDNLEVRKRGIKEKGDEYLYLSNGVNNNNNKNKYNDLHLKTSPEIQQTIGENSDAPFEIKQEIQQTIVRNVSEIEKFEDFIEDYEIFIKETLFKNLDDVKYINQANKKFVLEINEIIIILLNNIKEMGINRLKNADVINIKNLLMKIKNEKIFKIYDNITKYKNRHFFIYEKTDQYIIDNMKELCEEFESVIDYYENPSKFKKEEAKRKVREEYEKKFSEKNSEKNKEKEPLNSITNSAEEKREKEERLGNLNEIKTDDFKLKHKKRPKKKRVAKKYKEKQEKPINWIRNVEEEEKIKKERLEEDLEEEDLEIETTNGFMLRPKHLKRGLKLTDLYKKNLKKFKNKKTKNKKTKNEEDDKISLIENKMSSNVKGLLYTFKDKFFAEREKRGKKIDATYLKNDFETKYEKLTESIRVKLEELKYLLKTYCVDLKKPYETSKDPKKKIILSDITKHINKVKKEFFTRNKILIDSEISSLFLSNNVFNYEIIRKQYKNILLSLIGEEYYLKRIIRHLMEKGSFFKYEYLEKKFKQIANIYACSINRRGDEIRFDDYFDTCSDYDDDYEYKDDEVDYYVYEDVEANDEVVPSDGEGYDCKYEDYLYGDE